MEAQVDLLNLFKQLKVSLQANHPDTDSAFTALDQNGSGLIELDDLELGLASITEDKDQIKLLFQLINKSNSGAITQEELEALWTQLDRELASLQNRIELAKQQQQVQQPPQPSKQPFTIDQLFNSKAEIATKEAVSLTVSSLLGKGLSGQGQPVKQTVRSSVRSSVRPFDDFKLVESRTQVSPIMQVYPKVSYLNDFLSPLKKASFLNRRIYTDSNNNINRAQNMRKDFKSYVNLIGLGSGSTSDERPRATYNNFNFRQSPQNNSKPSLKDIYLNSDFLHANYRSKSGQRSRQRLLKNKSLSRSEDRIDVFQPLKQLVDKLEFQRRPSNNLRRKLL